MKRRTFLKNTLAVTATGAAVSAGLVVPNVALAEEKVNLEGASEVRIFIANNPTPHAANFTLGDGAEALVKCRFKMGKSSDVIGVVKVGDKYFSAKKAVKVTKGGCGG